MITRRSFFTGLAAALVAPAFVKRALQRFGWQSVIMGIDFGSEDRAVVTLLKRRIADAQEQMVVNVSHSIYGGGGAGLGGLFGTAGTLRESLMERAEHHYQRAAYWRIQGKPEYAMGSLHKAAVAEDRARSLPA